MGISKIFTSGVSSVTNYVKKNPGKVGTALISGAAGIGGLLLSNALTTKQDKASEFVNRSVLINPVLNPTGCLRHILNPKDDNTNDFDNPLVKYFVDNNKQKYQNKPAMTTENVKKLAAYVIYNNNKIRVINADDGGQIELYANDQNKIIGSINKDKDGNIRNISTYTADGKEYIVNKDDNGNWYSMLQTKRGNMSNAVKEFYKNGGKGVNFD